LPKTQKFKVKFKNGEIYGDEIPLLAIAVKLNSTDSGVMVSSLLCG